MAQIDERLDPGTAEIAGSSHASASPCNTRTVVVRIQAEDRPAAQAWPAFAAHRVPVEQPTDMTVPGDGLSDVTDASLGRPQRSRGDGLRSRTTALMPWRHCQRTGPSST